MPDNPATADPKAKPRRRWFQFRLRTLLIGIALLAVPLGYVAREAKIVRERNAMLAELRIAGCAYLTAAGLDEVGAKSRNIDLRIATQGSKVLLSNARRWLGDENISDIWLPKSLQLTEVTRIEQSFPEADVWQFDSQEIPRHRQTRN